VVFEGGDEDDHMASNWKRKMQDRAGKWGSMYITYLLVHLLYVEKRID
jgi:hypothetical protein